MGSGRFDADEWKGYATTSGYAHKSAEEIYTSRKIDPELDPKGVKVRESRDSADNPNSTALAITLDVTGSMQPVLESVAKKAVQTLLTEIYDRKPVSDPHVMFMAVGDAEAGDTAPLQATQFEADMRIAKQLEKVFFEQGGGGNSYESYALAWYFAANHTALDCLEKRNKKGYLFTIGDEKPTPYLRQEDIERVLGYKPQAKKTSMDEILTAVSRKFEIFHVIIEEGNHYRGDPHGVSSAWKEVLGQRVIHLADHTKLAEVIVSAIQVVEGADHKEVAKSWDGTTSVVVGKAIKDLAKSTSVGGVVTL